MIQPEYRSQGHMMKTLDCVQIHWIGLWTERFFCQQRHYRSGIVGLHLTEEGWSWPSELCAPLSWERSGCPFGASAPVYIAGEPRPPFKFVDGEVRGGVGPGWAQSTSQPGPFSLTSHSPLSIPGESPKFYVTYDNSNNMEHWK